MGGKEFKEVSKQEFDAFVNSYVNDLDRYVITVGEPPILTLNDFANGNEYPQSIVAKVILYDGSEYHGYKQPKYLIRTAIFSGCRWITNKERT